MTKLDPDSRLKGLDYLQSDFVKKLQKLKANLSKQAVNLQFGMSIVGPKAQGRMWCAGSTIEMMQIQKKLMINAGADKLAEYLREEWCALEETQTQHLPGASWHNHAQAVQVFVQVQEEAVWRSTKYLELIVDECKRLNLNHGTKLRGAKKFCHVQFHPHYSPFLMKHGAVSWKDIQREMAQRFELS